ncbi:MAG TPA: lysophospholipid acyltransferase family protein [Myxococcota bacterium]|nr:lysophospholipid acyltransferase family protein [Myxococcota bacterium]
MEADRPRLLERLLVSLAVPLLYLLGRTLRARDLGRTDWKLHDARENALWALWHETLLIGIWYFRGLGVHVMISASRDGARIAGIAQRFGYVALRGSTSKGSLAATRRLVGGLREGRLAAITPDGPRGPRRCAQPGAVTVARLSGRPVVAIGIGPERCWRLPSWDRFAIPKPFSRVHYVYGDPISVPREGGSDADYLAQIQRELDRVTEIADAAARGELRARDPIAQRAR